MPIYEYRGLDKKGKKVKGVVDADSLRSARLKLKKDQIFVADIKDKNKITSKSRKKNKFKGVIPIKDLSLMTRQLATLIKANIPLVDSLSAVSEQVENPVLSEALADCKNMVNEGLTLHKAFSKYPNIFNNIYLTMVEAGEAAGALDNILLRLAEFTEAQHELKQKVKGAMTYPVIMLTVTLLILTGLFIFIIPKMVAVFDSFPELQLPWYTTVLIDISNFMIAYWYLVFGSAFGLYILFNNWKKTPSGSVQWDEISLKLPVMGEMTRLISVARFTRTLSTLLTGGVPMLNAMDIVKNVVDNHVISKAVIEARNNISEGETIAGPLKRSGQFPPIVIHMISIGEKTGELENMLTQVSDAFDFQVKNKVDSMTSIMGPVVIVIMGVVIGCIVFAILIPMMEMSNIGG